VADRRLNPPLGLLAAVPMTDGDSTSPVVADGRIYLVVASGVATSLAAATFKVLRRFTSSPRPTNAR
jgi:hypothetical protein